MQQLDKEDDVNKVLRYFSYEHFYVIYCKVRVDMRTCTLRLTMPMTMQKCLSPFHICLQACTCLAELTVKDSLAPRTEVTLDDLRSCADESAVLGA